MKKINHSDGGKNIGGKKKNCLTKKEEPNFFLAKIDMSIFPTFFFF